MSWLNYHHLLYFWTVARLGSVKAAAVELQLSPPTVSAQVKSLESALGEKLFERAGGGLALTEMGRVTYRYAEEIFALGRELRGIFEGEQPSAERLVVGISGYVPKLVVHRLLAPILGGASPVRVVCREDTTERLLAELAVHQLDLVLAEVPVSKQLSVKAYDHPLGECGVSFFGSPALARAYRPTFPASLHGAPLLVPSAESPARRALDGWLRQRALVPRIVAEFEDTALMKAFGREGAGIFPAPSAIEDEIRAVYGTELLGRIPELKERFYMITVERRITHPALRAIQEAARGGLFA